MLLCEHAAASSTSQTNPRALNEQFLWFHAPTYDQVRGASAFGIFVVQLLMDPVGHNKKKEQSMGKTFPCRPVLRVFSFSNSHDPFGWPYTGPMNSALTFVQMTFKMSLPG